MSFFSQGYRGRVMRALGTCEGFAHNGWDVTVVGGNQLKNFRDDLPSSVKIIEINEPGGFLKFFFWWMKVFITFLKLKNKNDYSVLLIRYVFSSFFLILLISFFSIKSQKTILETTGFMSHIFRNIPFLYWLERFLFNSFNLIYTDSYKQKNDIESLVNTKTKIINIPNGCTIKKIKSFKTPRCISRVPRLFYFGTVSKFYNFDIFAKFINKLNKSLKIETIVLGSGPYLKYLKKKFVNNDKVTLYGKFVRSDLGFLINYENDILFLPELIKNDTGGLSTKLFDYMSIKLPIIAPNGGELSSILFNNYNALLYKRGNFKSFYFCVKKLFNDPNLRSYLAKNSYIDFKKKHTWKIRIKTLIDNI